MNSTSLHGLKISFESPKLLFREVVSWLDNGLSENAVLQSPLPITKCWDSDPRGSEKYRRRPWEPRAKQRAELVPPVVQAEREVGTRGSSPPPRREPTYPGGWPGRRPLATAAGPGAAGGRRLRAGPAYWLFLQPRTPASEAAWPCLGVPSCALTLRRAPRAAQVQGARGAASGAAVGGGAELSALAAASAAGAGLFMVWPDGAGGGPRPGRPPWRGSRFAGKRGGGRAGSVGGGGDELRVARGRRRGLAGPGRARVLGRERGSQGCSRHTGRGRDEVTLSAPPPSFLLLFSKKNRAWRGFVTPVARRRFPWE